ncbi:MULTISPECIES: hypothetical protein [unclassified Nonomuraea]|uniref:hypothetical protein n=1 Tax=unclassified Nonomuraea TaxID=2593643 RepID=UPI0033C11140
MGRHGTGGSDDASERGNGRSDDSQDEDSGLTDRAAQWAAAPDPTARSSFWDSDDQQAEPPGWPEPPDQVGVTGQWAPMPKQEPGPAVRRPENDPFETTGAFQPPSRGAGGPGPAADQPFETTGAFVRPPNWDEPGAWDAPARGEVGDSTQTFGMPQDFGGDRPSSPNVFGGDAPSGPHGFGGDRPSSPNVFGGDAPSGPHGFGPGAPQAFGPADPHATAPGAPHGLGPAGPFGAADQRPSGADATQVFGQDRDASGQTQALQPPAGGPPEPGDVKVYGSPTMMDLQGPEWSERPDNGFLGSGWSGDDEPAGERAGERDKGRDGGRDSGRDGEPEPRRRGRRKSPSGDTDPFAEPPAKGRGRLALLSVAAVAVVLGGTVAGVKLMSGGSQPAGCPGDGCAAVQATNQPGPQGSQPVEEDTEPAEDETEEPTEEPTGKTAQPAGTPGPQATTGTRVPRRTASPQPKPTKTKKPARATQEPLPTSFQATETSTPEEVATITVTDPADNTSGNPAPTAPSTETAAPMGGGSVSLGFSVVSQRLTGYTAHLDVANASPQALKSLTVSVPVKGRVLNMTGAEWTQDGDLLIIDLPDSLDEGDSTEITFTATGRAAEPRNCGLVGGDCAVD